MIRKAHKGSSSFILEWPKYGMEFSVPLKGERGLIDLSRYAIVMRDEDFFRKLRHWHLFQELTLVTKLKKFHPSIELGGGLRWKPLHNFSVVFKTNIGNDGFQFSDSNQWYLKPQIEIHFGLMSIHSGFRVYADSGYLHHIGIGFDISKMIDKKLE